MRATPYSVWARVWYSLERGLKPPRHALGRFLMLASHLNHRFIDKYKFEFCLFRTAYLSSSQFVFFGNLCCDNSVESLACHRAVVARRPAPPVHNG